jgi:dynein heavy chain
LKLEYDELLSSFAFKFTLRRYMKGFPKPPPLVQLTMEAVCILLGEKPDWDTAKKVLSDKDFMRNLYDFDKDNIPEKTIKALKKYIENPDYTPEAVQRQSKAGAYTDPLFSST